MQDGAPCHRRLDIKMFLSETFNNRVISVGHEVEWPPRSPDLTPFDFFLWGYLKDQVFKTTPTDLGELRTRITHHINVLKENAASDEVNESKVSKMPGQEWRPCLTPYILVCLTKFM